MKENNNKIKVVVTGADGFIGSHLTEHLIDCGYNVTAMVLYNSFGYNGWLENLAPEKLSQIKIVSGDVRDYHSVLQATRNADIIFHLAALIAIPYSYTAPDSYVDTNIKGTLNIVQAAREHKTSRVIVTSTSEVYGTAKYVPIDEVHPLQGQSPYSASKIGADKIAESFYRSFQLPLTIVRPFNTYGPRQSARAIIPTIISQLLNNETEIKIGNITPTRDFVFVKDTATGFEKIANANDAIGEEINIATQQEISIGNLAQMLITKINPEAKIITDEQRLRPNNSEVERLLGSTVKLLKITGWQPTTKLETGIEQTINWFTNKDNLRLYKHNQYNV